MIEFYCSTLLDNSDSTIDLFRAEFEFFKEKPLLFARHYFSSLAVLDALGLNERENFASSASLSLSAYYLTMLGCGGSLLGRRAKSTATSQFSRALGREPSEKNSLMRNRGLLKSAALQTR